MREVVKALIPDTVCVGVGGFVGVCVWVWLCEGMFVCECEYVCMCVSAQARTDNIPFAHQKDAGSASTSMASWGLGEKTFSPWGKAAFETRHTE